MKQDTKTRRLLPVIYGLPQILILPVTVILVLALGSGAFAFTQPEEIEKKVPVVKYEHKGKFDYTTRQRVSYVFGDLTLEEALAPPAVEEDTFGPAPPQGTPKYPIAYIQRFDMSFRYQLLTNKPADTSIDIEVKELFQADNQPRQIDLVPRTTKDKMDDITISFSPSLLDLFEYPPVTIQATVYSVIKAVDSAPVFESFSQSLVIQSNGPYLEVNKNLKTSSRASFGDLIYEQIGTFDYSVVLSGSPPFGDVTLTPPQPAPPALPPTPAPPPPLSARVFKSDETIFFDLFDSLDMTFSYNLEAERPVRQLEEEVEINAVLENPGVWRKTFVLSPLNKDSGAFTVNFPLKADDFKNYINVFKAIEKETGVSVPYNLTVEATVHTTAQTEFGPIDETFIQKLSTQLGAQTLSWKENLEFAQPGTIEQAMVLPNRLKYVGLTITAMRDFSIIIATVLLVLLLSLLALRVWLKPEESFCIEEEVKRVKKKHRDAVVDVEQLPAPDPKEMIIMLSSLNDLVKTADALFKPVLHKDSREGHTYCVIDGFTRYQFVLTASTKEQGNH